MASKLSFKELSEELSKRKIELSKLRSLLNELDSEKESWFGKKKEFSKKIKAGIQKIKEDKAKRDALTKEVKELKPKRDALNEKISSRLGEISQLKIKDTIDKLEFKIETEAISFEKEKELMKKINELRKRYGNARILNDMAKESNAIHKLMQERARESQMLHEAILAISADVDAAKAEEEQAFGKFSELKAKFSQENAKFKEKLKEMNGIRDRLETINSARKDKKRTWQESFLKTKEEEVNEKIRKGEKLTTEDLLVFQKINESSCS